MEPENKPQTEPTFDERMAPWKVRIGELKEELARQGSAFDFVAHFGVDAPQDYAEWIAAAAFCEEYELLEYLFEFRAALLRTYPDHRERFGDGFDILNAHVSPEFAHWEPTPLYFVTSRKAWGIMKDPCKMVRFLVEHGADVNRAAADGSTLLWNQAASGGRLEILKTLLALGANPNQTSLNNGVECVPLVTCLLPDFDREDVVSWIPIDHTEMQKAELLLKHGADPNSTSSTLQDYPPLMLVVMYGFPRERRVDDSLSPYVLDFIELLLKSGADPNFTSSEGVTPLSAAAGNNLLEVGQLLLLYGAKMPEEKEEPEAWLKATEDCFFRPGGGDPWEESTCFTKEEILGAENNVFNVRYFKIILSERTPVLLKGEIVFEEGKLKISAGEFTLNAENTAYSTEYLNVAYDTHLRLSLEWMGADEEVDDGILDAGAHSIEELIGIADQEHDAMVPRPATEDDLDFCNNELRDCDFPEIPDDYAGFLKICMGFAFNSVELYGPDTITDRTGFTLIDIVDATESFNEHYVDGGYIGIDYPLLCIGRQNGDYFTYDPSTGKYQLRDHEDACNTVWEEYDTFQEFFVNEVARYSGLVAQEGGTGGDGDAEDETDGSLSAVYAKYINEYILPAIDYDQLQESYQTDMVYAKGVLNCLHEAMVAINGGKQIDEEDGDDGFVTVPGILRGINSGSMCIALFSINISDGGELWQTYYLCANGVISQDEAGEEIRQRYIPYEYGYTVTIPGDYHVEQDRLSDELKAVLADFRNHRAKLSRTIDGEIYDMPRFQFYCDQCGTTNYFYDDNKPPYHCDNCQCELNLEDLD